MNKIPLEVGRVVRSKAGRDCGRLFLILEELDQDFVTMVDGSLRKIDRPKKKRRKHIEATLTLIPNIGLKQLSDAEIRQWLDASTPNNAEQ